MKEPIYFAKIKHKGIIYDCVLKDSSKFVRINTKKGSVKISEYDIIDKKVIGYSNNL